MRKNCLNRDRIENKYNFMGGLIDYAKIVGTSFGFGYTLLGLGSEDIRLLGISAGVGTISLLSGNYLYKRNNNKKQKALKNIEKNLLQKENIK